MSQYHLVLNHSARVNGGADIAKKEKDDDDDRNNNNIGDNDVAFNRAKEHNGRKEILTENNRRKTTAENGHWTPIINGNTGVREKNDHRMSINNGNTARWIGKAQDQDVSTGPLACPFAHSLAQLIHSLAPHCFLCIARFTRMLRSKPVLATAGP